MKTTNNDGWSDVSLRGIFWTFNGRLDRFRFFQRITLAFILGYLFSELGSWMTGSWEGGFLGLPFYISTFSIVVRRAHDFGWPAKRAVLLWFIPLVNCLFLGVLFSRKGTKGRNLYGNEPVLPSKSRKVSERE